MSTMKKEMTTAGKHHVRAKDVLLIAVLALAVLQLLSLIGILPGIVGLLLPIVYAVYGVLLFLRRSATMFAKAAGVLAVVYGAVGILTGLLGISLPTIIPTIVFMLYLVAIIITNDFYLPLRGIQAVQLLFLILGFAGIFSLAWITPICEILFCVVWAFLSNKKELGAK